ncbi:hypothetical protein C8J36_11436 [Rhizobium sp. PP-F2F-G48]|uniref:hypothetical protein n=1 Tax=Rhizobium sp. PP-F2F-G48 TaxID=2135651 RepID=UPI001044BECC|nr:hypothetical protein [Rhizobium sp. PP-F2F-G48]TCM48336.1 hypothetical protein C8J36_11436 [Rhizobium sp. PP-F2F-G48]
MADSETNRTLPPITHRNLLSTAVALLSAYDAKPRSEVSREDPQLDAALLCWQEWATAQARLTQLNDTQSRLEKAMAREVLPAHVMLEVLERPAPVFAETDEEIHHWMKGPHYKKARLSAKTELGKRRAAWNAADIRIGFTKAKRAEEAAADRSAQLSDELLDLPASSVAGLAAKLHVVITDGQPGPDNGEFPWPQLRLILLDIVRLLNAGPAVADPP